MVMCTSDMLPLVLVSSCFFMNLQDKLLPLLCCMEISNPKMEEVWGKSSSLAPIHVLRMKGISFWVWERAMFSEMYSEKTQMLLVQLLDSEQLSDSGAR